MVKCTPSFGAVTLFVANKAPRSKGAFDRGLVPDDKPGRLHSFGKAYYVGGIEMDQNRTKRFWPTIRTRQFTHGATPCVAQTFSTL
jgi:hypothetical protein